MAFLERKIGSLNEEIRDKTGRIDGLIHQRGVAPKTGKSAVAAQKRYLVEQESLESQVKTAGQSLAQAQAALKRARPRVEVERERGGGALA